MLARGILHVMVEENRAVQPTEFTLAFYRSTARVQNALTTRHQQPTQHLLMSSKFPFQAIPFLYPCHCLHFCVRLSAIHAHLANLPVPGCMYHVGDLSWSLI